MLSCPGKKILKDVNLHINPGRIIAIAGENESRKTTLMKLLCKLCDPVDDRITFDGIDLHDFRIIDLRKDLSSIFQDYAHYYLTAKENIWISSTDTPIDMKILGRLQNFWKLIMLLIA